MTHTTHTQQAIFASFVVDEQTIAQGEQERHITQQGAPEEFTVVEITCYDYEIYFGEKLIASITYDHDDFVTQRWVVIVNSTEEHRANSWAKCHNHIVWHHKQGTLSVQKQKIPATTTGNEVMAQIALECEKFGFELLDDGIYNNDKKLGSAGCSGGRWWVERASSDHQQQVPCDSAFDAVWSLSMVEVLPSLKTKSCDELLDKPFDQLTSEEWKRLMESLPEDNLARLWILAPSASESLLNSFGAKLELENWTTGVYFLANSLRTAIVAINQLPVSSETLWLRLLGKGETQRQAVTELLALPDNNVVRQNTLKLITNWRIISIQQPENLTQDDQELIMNLSQAYQEWEETTKQQARLEETTRSCRKFA